jgi:hypothetical protein
MNTLHGRLSCTKWETAGSVGSKPIRDGVLWRYMKMALCNPHFLLFCFPAADTVNNALFLCNATNSPEKFTVL